jgi:hypothetical protein
MSIITSNSFVKRGDCVASKNKNNTGGSQFQEHETMQASEQNNSSSQQGTNTKQQNKGKEKRK